MSDAGMEGSSQPPLNPPQSAGPGAQLAARRQELGWTVEQVANQLNLAPRQVQAMEEDNYPALPGMVIARGFVRAYAKLLRLDPAPLLALIADKSAPSPEALELRRTLSATFTESNLPTATRSGNGGKWLALFLIVLVLAAAAWLAWREGWMNDVTLPGGLSLPSSSSPASQSAPAVAEPGSGAPLGQAGEGAASASAPEKSAPAVSDQPAMPTPTPSAPAPVPAIPPAQPSGAIPAQDGAVAAVAAAPVPSTAAGTAAAASGNSLVLKLREASWVEIRREDGSTVASRLLPAGSTESFDIAGGASLVVGNAGGVDATFRGQRLDLTTSAKSNVARLKLK